MSGFIHGLGKVGVWVSFILPSDLNELLRSSYYIVLLTLRQIIIDIQKRHYILIHLFDSIFGRQLRKTLTICGQILR